MPHFGWLLIILIAPGLLALLAVVAALLFRGPPADRDGPGYFHVMGIDKTSGVRREMTLQAESRSSARGRAAFDGIVVTQIQRVQQ